MPFNSFSFVILLLSDICHGVVSSPQPFATKENKHRSLTLTGQNFFNYYPRTNVATTAALDQDLKQIDGELGKQIPSGFHNAYNIYSNGANSMSYASVTLDAPLRADEEKGVYVEGRSESGAFVGGTLLESAAQGDTHIEILYTASNAGTLDFGCRVGASISPVVGGCFAGTGSLTIGIESYTYAYNPLEDNLNKQTIQSLSTTAKEVMNDCEFCPLETFSKFYNYYGRYDYADHWIQSAFDREHTDFDNGNADFSIYDDASIEEVIMKGTSQMNIWMYVIRMMELAVDTCCEVDEGAILESGSCSWWSVHHWDVSVSYYTGSLQDNGDDGDGYSLYALANNRCKAFGTCGEDGMSNIGPAKVNFDIFQLFNSGKDNILNGQCGLARKNKEAIEKLMAVPLIQGTLQLASYTDHHGPDTGFYSAFGASYAASVLPLVHYCSVDDSNVIFRNMHSHTKALVGPAYGEVKAALERNYGCLGVTCDDIGIGTFDENGGNSRSTLESCGARRTSNPSDSGTATSSLPVYNNAYILLAVGWGAGFFCALSFFLVFLSRRNSSRSILVKDTDDIADDVILEGEMS